MATSTAPQPSLEKKDLDPELIEISLDSDVVHPTETRPGLPQTIGASSEIPPSSSGSSCTTATQEQEVANEMRLVRDAKIISIVSTLVSFMLGFVAFGVAIADEALTLAGLGGEMILDGVSSLLVYWRFKTPKPREFGDAAEALKHKLERDARRERNSSLLIGITFVFLACILGGTASHKLMQWNPIDHIHQQKESASLGNVIAWPSFLIFGCLAVVKHNLSRKLHSRVLGKDAFCSALGALLSLIVAISAAIEEANTGDPENLKKIDGVATIIIAVILLADGLRTIQQNVSSSKTQNQHMRF